MAGAIPGWVPAIARDLFDDYVIHWGFEFDTDDPFMAGARWAEAQAYDRLFGEEIGDALREVSVAEKWNPASQEWRALTA